MNYMPDARRELRAILEAIVVVVCWRWRWTSGEITRTASSDYFSHATFNWPTTRNRRPKCSCPHSITHVSATDTSSNECNTESTVKRLGPGPTSASLSYIVCKKSVFLSLRDGRPL